MWVRIPPAPPTDLNSENILLPASMQAGDCAVRVLAVSGCVRLVAAACGWLWQKIRVQVFTGPARLPASPQEFALCGVDSGQVLRGHVERCRGHRRQRKESTMSTVTTSPDISVEHAPSRLTSTLLRSTVSVGVLAAAVTTAGAVALRAAGVPLAVHGKIPLAGFAQVTFIAAVIGGVLLALLNRRSSAPRRRFVQMTIGAHGDLLRRSRRRSQTRPPANSPWLRCTWSPRRSLFRCSHDTPTDPNPTRYQEEQPRCRNT